MEFVYDFTLLNLALFSVKHKKRGVLAVLRLEARPKINGSVCVNLIFDLFSRKLETHKDAFSTVTSVSPAVCGCRKMVVPTTYLL
jgi:hypothetical protein